MKIFTLAVITRLPQVDCYRLHFCN